MSSADRWRLTVSANWLPSWLRRLCVSCFPVAGPKGIDRVARVLLDVTEHTETDRSLHLFRALIDQSNDAVEVIDPESLSFMDVNDRACKDLGYTREELLGLTVYDIDPAVHESVRRATVERLRSGDSVVKEAIHKRKDGSTFPVETSMKLVELDRAYIVTVSRDINERKRAQEALRESEDRYRDLVEHSEDLVCTHDLQGNLLSVNPAPARVLGYSVDELLNIPMRSLIAPEFRDQFDVYLQAIQHTGSQKGLLCVLTRTGKRRIWEYNNSLRAEGVPSPIVRGMAHDVTERKQTESALRCSEQRYRTLFEKAVAGVGTISIEGKVVDCNDAWARMFGHQDASQCRGSQIVDRYRDPSQRDALLAELRERGSFLNREWELRRKDGSLFWVLLNSVLITEEDGKQLIQSTMFDITERKSAADALRRSEESYRNFVTQSSEGIFRQDLDAPVPIDLPEDELVHRILTDSYLAECNEAIVKMYGLNSVGDFLGRRLTEFVDPADPRNIELTREYIRSGFRVVDRESHETDLQGNPKVFRNSMIGVIESGMLVRTWGIQRDCTEQAKLEEARYAALSALRKSEEHFRILVEQASDGIFIADEQGKYIDVNSVGAEMLGYTRDEVLHLSIHDVVVPEEKPSVEEERIHLVQAGSILNEWRFRRKDGSIFYGEVSGRRLPDGRLQGILRDVTERKRSEEILRQSEERFRVALKDSPITVFNQDRDLRYTWIYNPQLHWQHDALGRTDEEILGTKKAAPLTELASRVLLTGRAVRQEVAIPQNGSSHAFDVTVEPLFDRQNRVVGITAACMDIARLREMADRLQEATDRLSQEKSYLEDQIQTELGFEEIIGQSHSLRDVLKKTRVVAATDSTVLLLGETGTGKELIARSVHSLSPRRGNTFVKLNCAAVPSGLLESELFGHEKGAFTGAVSQKIGRMELADKGTLFLDEIGELPPELQPKLLRVLQDREFERLGGVRTIKVDVRIISATNRDLHQDIADKKFREDLFYRLNVFPIELPPLRDRRDDIPLLVQHFVKKHAGRMSRRIEVIPDEVMRALRNWSWPGNIRELENMIERMVILSKGSVLASPPAELENVDAGSDDNLTEMEREHIIRILRETNGVLSGDDGAANRLGLKRTTLQSMMKRLGIEPQEYRGRGNGTFGRP